VNGRCVTVNLRPRWWVPPLLNAMCWLARVGLLPDAAGWCLVEFVLAHGYRVEADDRSAAV
jgi:hypothetical protein